MGRRRLPANELKQIENKLKNVTNTMCFKTAINAGLKKLIARLTRLKIA